MVSELDILRTAHLVMQRPNPDAYVRERLAALSGDADGHAVWMRIAAAMAVLRAEKPEAGPADALTRGRVERFRGRQGGGTGGTEPCAGPEPVVEARLLRSHRTRA